jgi:hypothetical protein
MPQGVAPDCQSVITEWRVRDPGKRNSMVDVHSARELMRIDKPQFNHNGGALAFGVDQMLYISLGDGGGADDEGVGHAPQGNAQSLAPGNVLGKILRVDPLGRNAANTAFLPITPWSARPAPMKSSLTVSAIRSGCPSIRSAACTSATSARTTSRKSTS